MPLDGKLLYLFNTVAVKSEVFDKYVLIAAFLLLLYFSAYSRRKNLRIFWATTVSLIVARLGVTPMVRFFYYRPWPFHTYQLRLLIGENKWSFPSGHSAFLFAMATVLYFYNKKWGIGFFIYAIAIIISRTVAGLYYPLDSFGGMIIGMLTAYIVFYIVEIRKAKEIAKGR